MKLGVALRTRQKKARPRRMAENRESLEEVRRKLVDRLEEGDRGDRGWFVITRVHVALSWLKGIAEYLENL